MYQHYGDILTISVNDWMAAGLTERQFHYDSKSLSLTIVKRGINGNTLIDVRSVKRPDRRAAIEAAFGRIDDADRKPDFMDVTPDAEAAEFFRTYTYTDESGKERHLPEETQRQYCTEAAILNMFRRVNVRQTAARANGRRKTKKEFYAECAKRAAELAKDPATANSLPSNPRSLERKMDEYIDKGYESLVSGLYGKSNSAKLTEDAKFWLVARFATPVNKVTVQQLFEEYNAECKKHDDWKPLSSEQTIRAFLNRPDVKQLWWGMRYGELKSKEKYTRQHKTELPQLRDALWYGDGTKLNFYYTTEDGRMATTNVYEVVDAYSECLIGYHVSEHEDFEAQYMAFRMAIQFAGHKPNEIRYDNQGGHKKLAAGSFFEKIAHLNIPCAPYNGPSKTIESIFKRYQESYLHKEWYFTGQNITTKKRESRENYEFVMANKASIPSLEEAKKIYAMHREEWNNAPHPKTGIPRIEMYRSSVNAKTQAVTPLDMIDMFGVIDPVANTYTASGICKTVKKTDYRWEVLTSDGEPDFDFLRRNVDRKFHIGYDLNDMGMVALYTKDAKGYRFEAYAQKYIEIHRAKQEQDDFDHKFIKATEMANKRLRVEMTDEIETIMEKYGMHPAQHGLNMPKPKGLNLKEEDYGRMTKRTSNLVTSDIENQY